MILEKVSNSSLSTYSDCPQKFFFSYVRQIWPEKKPQALAVGGAVHKVLAELYERKKNNKTLELSEASDIFLRALKSYPIELKDTSEDVILLNAQDMLKKAITSPLDVKPVYIEYSFEVPFVNPITKEDLGVKLKGIMDLIAELDIIVEHKTSSKKYVPETILKSFQHVGYFVGYFNLFNKKPSKILYDVIYKVKDPVIDVFEVKVSDKDIRKYFDWARNIIKNIKKDNWKPKPDPLKCRWCDYKNICGSSKA
jgi:CRISPR/Cas system-associated exonuclease Cas4 (RecB family)